MKKYIIGLLALSIALVSCNSGKNNTTTTHPASESHVHTDGDGHDHDNEKDHDHSAEDGHDHGDMHTDGDGHDHANESDHKHSADDGHDHSAEALEDNHSDEIIFTRQQAETAGLRTETVSLSSFSQVIKTSGQVQNPQGDEVTIVATSNGIVSFANPSIVDGLAVRQGEAIVTISARNIQDGDPAAKAKIEFETAEREYRRAEGLVADRIISQKDFNEAKLRYETAKNVYQAQAANMTANGVRVTTPIGGYIKNRLVSQGEYVSIGQPIVTISQNRKLQLRAEVSERYFRLLPSITGANFKLSYGDDVYKLSDLNGRLLSYGKASDQVSFYVPVTFEFDNVGEVMPGSFVEVYLLGSSINNVIAIPRTSLTEEQGIYFVYLQLGAEEYKKQEVAIGQDDGSRVQIVTGLKPGDKVVTRGVYQVKLAATSSVMPEGHSH